MTRRVPVVVVTHAAGEMTPAHHLARFLDRRGQAFWLVSLPFHFSALPFALCERHQRGSAEPAQALAPRRGSLPLQLASDLLVLLKLFLLGPRVGLWVGLDNLNAFAGLVLKRLGRVDKVAYYVIDHTPRRFENRLLNWLYAAVDRACCRHADHVWVLGQRMEDAKAERGASRERLVRVPIGVSLGQLGPIPPQGGRPGALVVVSHLAKSKGIQLLLEAMPLVRAAVPEAILTVIGGGPYEQDLRRLAASLGLGGAVEFKGFVAEHAQVLASLPGYRVGLAPYLADGGANYSYWADPAKPKEYLAAGLPVVITRVPEISERIAAEPMGLAVDYDKEALAAACIRLLSDQQLWGRCHANALGFAKGLDWDGIFDRALKACGLDADEDWEVPGWRP